MLELNDDNFTLYAAQHYTRSCLDISEFNEDISRFKYLKRLFNKYREHNELQERLILNHIIIIHNVFAVAAASAMCFYRVHPESYPALKTFLLYLNYIHPESYPEIPCDAYVVKQLQKI